MVKKDKKAKAAEKKVRVAQKQDKKAAQKEKKAKPKRADDSDAEDVDLDAVLAAYAKQQEQFLKVTESVVEPPSARASATILASPANDNELFVFGGEYFNGALAKFYNDLFVYNVHRDEWRQVTSPNTPLPRSGHAWCRGGNGGGIYMFGGEFSSPKQGTFYHYNDFWRLDPATREWTKLENKGKGPPARSGHRMTYFKSYIILYGGFQDTSQQTRYLSDLWIYDCAAYTWHAPVLPPASQKPDARSSFTLLPHDSGAVLYGGYSRVKSSTPVRATKGSTGATQTTLKPLVHQDTWFLRITPPPPEAPSHTLPTVRWERRKRPANAPNPARAGATMAHHKGRGVQFGGVHDVEESDEGIDSEFFNTLYVWNVERNRYFSLALRRPRAAAAKKATPTADRPRRGRGRADEEDLLRNLAALEAGAKLPAADVGATTPAATPPLSLDLDDDDAASDDAAARRPEKPVAWEMPHARFNAQLAVQDDVLYIFGGTWERGDREYTFDEMWAVDLGKLDGVKQIYRREIEDWHGSDDEDDDEDSEGDEDDEDEDDEPGSGDEAAPPVPAPSAAAALAATNLDHTSTTDDAPAPSTSALSDSLPHPRPFESLRAFYARTSIAWQEVLLEEMKYLHRDAGGERSVKEIRKGAFERAEDKWWECREEIRALEDEQEEAGIGEVVSLAEKDAQGGGGGGGVGRRR